MIKIVSYVEWLRVEEDIEILELSQYVEKSHASNTK